MKKILLVLLTLLLLTALAACSADGECVHTYESQVTREPDCLQEGVRTYTCTVCQHTYSESIARTEHNYEGIVTTEVTCAQDGVTTYTCTVCRNSYTETTARLAHDYIANVTVEATCTQDGVITYTCSGCQDSYTETAARLAHSYTDEVTAAATCTKEGVRTYTCTACGDTYTEAITKVEHQYTASACTAAATCAVCGDTKGSALGHDWIDATCTSAKTCRRCGITEGGTLEHQYVSGSCVSCGAEQKYGGVLNVVWAGSGARELNPLATGNSNYIWTNSVIEGILSRDSVGNICPGVCDFELSADRLTLKLWPREGVKFHNGKEVTIQDIYCSIFCNSDTKMKDYVVGLIAEGYPIVDEENQTMTIRFTTYMEQTLHYLSQSATYLGVLPAEVWEACGEDGKISDLGAAACIGTGPYKVDVSRYVRGYRICLVRNDDYVCRSEDLTGMAGSAYAYCDEINIYLTDNIFTDVNANA